MKEGEMGDDMIEKYTEFLKGKIVTAPQSGFKVERSEVFETKTADFIEEPHQVDAVIWAVEGGRRALFESFGLGKTIQQLEICRLIIKHEGGKALIVCPLEVRKEFVKDARKLLGIEVQYVRTMEEANAAAASILISNYERVRDGDLDPKAFTVTSLDEASVLRSFGSKTYQTFLDKFQGVRFKFVATATPGPNSHKELIHYGGYLEVMDTGQALTRFFQRDSTKANNLTLYPHKEEEFWLWMSTWALFITLPSDLGYDDTGYDMPPMTVNYHCVSVDHETAGFDPHGQGNLIRDAALGLKDAAKEKRDSIADRVAKIKELLFNECFIDTMSYGNKERLSEKVLRKEQGTASGASAGEESKELPFEQGSDIREDKEMEIGQPREDEGAFKDSLREESGEDKPKKLGVVSPKQGTSIQDGQEKPFEAIRTVSGNLPRNEGNSGREMFDMQEDSENSLRRSLPHNGQSSGVALSQLQRGTWSDGRLGGQSQIRNRLSDQFIIWCELNEEQSQVEKMLKSCGVPFSSVHGSLNDDDRATRLEAWACGETRALIGKPSMLGSGMNFQQCSKAFFAGVTYLFNDTIQAIHRIQRFGQKETVEVDFIYTESEQAILDALKAKWTQHEYTVGQMRKIVKEYGLASTSVIDKLARTIGVHRTVAKGAKFEVVHNDTVLECAKMEENSVDLIVTSIPFSNHYEYTPSYNDFGHNKGNDEFFQQMGYLTPSLLKILKPGRVFACHVKDRVQFGNATGYGMPSIDPFHADCIAHYRSHGFIYFGMITIVTDVVRENNQTYRLGWTENSKDGTKMGVGCPEYVLLFRKLPTDTSKAYADVPVVKSKEDYTRAQWQIDAHALWRSSGNRLLTSDELKTIHVDKMQAIYREYSRGNVYDYEKHVELAQHLNDEDKLPSTFMVVAPGSWQEDVWDDVNRMLTLNTAQSAADREMHVCPLQFDTVDRLIERFSNRGEVVFDPFGGLFTVPMRAIKAGRLGKAAELNPDYFRDGVAYLKGLEADMIHPDLFDLVGEK